MMNQPGEENGEGVPVKRRRGRPEKIQQQSLSSAKRTSGRKEAAKAPKKSGKNPGSAPSREKTEREAKRTGRIRELIVIPKKASKAGVKYRLRGWGEFGTFSGKFGNCH